MQESKTLRALAGPMYTKFKSACMILFFSMLGSVPAAGQFPADEYRVLTRPYEPQATASIRVRTDLVLVRVVVRDRSGKVVAGLTQSNFELRNDGRVVPITVFSTQSSFEPTRSVPLEVRISNQPETTEPAIQQRFLGIFIDDRNMPLGDLVSALTCPLFPHSGSYDELRVLLRR